MAEVSKIAWTDSTFNPFIGCTKVSPGCDNCYAQAMMEARYGRVKWGAGEQRVRTSEANWKKPLAWERKAAASGARHFVFCGSLCDWADNEVPDEWRRDLTDLIAGTPHLTWLLLTKRIGNVSEIIENEWLGMLPGNVAIGATFVNQHEYDRDRVKLHSIKQTYGPAFTFGSFEPLIGAIALDIRAPDWIIVGGESRQNGQEPRYMHPTWARTMRDDAAYLGRAFFMKQMSDHAPIPDDLMMREFPLTTTKTAG